MGSTKFEIRSTKTWSVSNFGFRVSDFPHSGLASSPPRYVTPSEMRAKESEEFLQVEGECIGAQRIGLGIYSQTGKETVIENGRIDAHGRGDGLKQRGPGAGRTG